MLIYLARMHRAALADEFQQLLCLLPTCSRPGQIAFGRDTGIRPRMHQRLYGSRDKTVGDEKVLFDTELLVVLFEIAGTVILDAMAQRQVLSPRRRSYRIGLHNAQLTEGAF